jgi:hypothetical protein
MKDSRKIIKDGGVNLMGFLPPQISIKGSTITP